jgi:thioesterase domain-containing protein
MKIDGFMFHIRPNLFEALQAARSLLEKKPEVSRLLWIDAICVNQEDIPERNAQVAKMGRIYRDANHVLAWLGQRTKDSEVAFLSLMTLHEYEIRALSATGSRENSSGTSRQSVMPTGILGSGVDATRDRARETQDVAYVWRHMDALQLHESTAIIGLQRS